MITSIFPVNLAYFHHVNNIVFNPNG